MAERRARRSPRSTLVNTVAVRAAAFVIGSLITGCAYTAHESSAKVPAAVGVSVFPGAHRTVGNPGGDSADVEVKVPFLKLHITAVRYTTAQPAPAVIAFYKKELSKTGEVEVALHGPRTRIRGFAWKSGPGDVTIASGNVFVAVRPVGSGTEFAIIHPAVDEK